MEEAGKSGDVVCAAYFVSYLPREIKTLEGRRRHRLSPARQRGHRGATLHWHGAEAEQGAGDGESAGSGGGVSGVGGEACVVCCSVALCLCVLLYMDNWWHKDLSMEK